MGSEPITSPFPLVPGRHETNHEAKNPVTENARVSPSDWKLWDACDLETWQVEPVEWLVDLIIPKGTVGFLSGQPKLGKSLLALDLSLHLANSHLEPTRWLGRYECSPANCLYVAREDPARRIKERGLEMCRSYSWSFVMPETLHFLIREKLNLFDRNHIQWLGQKIEERETDFLILDVFNRMIPGLDENSAKDMAEAVDVIEDLNRGYGLTILMLDHTRKPAVGQKVIQEPNPFELRGSTAKYGCADFMICLGRSEQKGMLRMYCENKDTDQISDCLVTVSPKDSADPKFRWAQDADRLVNDRKAVGHANRQKILDLIGKDWMTRSKVQAETGLARSTVTDHLMALVELGAVEAQGENRNRRYRRTITDRPGVSIQPSTFSEVQ